MKQLASYTIVVLTTLGVLLLLWQFGEVVALFVLSLLITAIVRPIIAWLTQRGMSAAAARAFVFLTLLGSVILLLFLLSGPLVRELQQLTDQLALAYEVTFARWLMGTEWQQALTTRLPGPTELVKDLTGTNGGLLVSILLGATQTVLGAAAGFLLVIALSLYWSSDQDRFERLWLSLLPAGQRVRTRNTWRVIEMAMGDYLRSELVQSVLAALLIGGGMALLGVPYPMVLGLVAGIAWLVPLAGAVVIATMTFVGGYTLTVGIGLLALIYTMVILYLLEFVIEPRLYNRQRYSSFWVILFMWPMAELFGLIGLILAPALAAASQLLMRQLLSPQPNNGQIIILANLEQRYTELHQLFTHPSEEPYSPEIGNILERLAQLIQRTKTTIGAP
jgi:predicted PurR-regulated permease PerM